MNTLNYNNIRFLKSAQAPKDLPPDTGSEVAFVGRSNSGKSSAINTITGVSKLARTSKTPGRTQLINFFELDENHRLVDLPGYGFAKVPDSVKRKWEAMIESYFSERVSVKGLILLMDIRHPLKPSDWHMIEWALKRLLPIHILLTKADKFKRGQALNTLLGVRKELSGYENLITIQLFSAFSGLGIEDAQKTLDVWLTQK